MLFFFQAEDGIRDVAVTGVQTCALPIYIRSLASIGIYGLLAYMVGQRSREIGLRLALGAQRADVLRLVLGKGVVLAGLGIVAGVIFSASTASMMASLLYGVRPYDPAVFSMVPLLLLVVAIAASYIPAWRATKVDPIVALRES